MPKVTIAEKDLTNAEVASFDDYITLIPGTSEKQVGGYEEYFEGNEEGRLGFEARIGGSTVASKMARQLLNLGMTILFVVVDSPETTLADYTNFWEKYSDRGIYNLRFLTAGGYANKSIADAMIKCAGKRGDATALIDVPELGDSGDEEFSGDYVKEFIDSLTDTKISRVIGGKTVTESALKYGAVFTKRVAFSEEEDAWLPGSFAYISCFVKHTERFPDWFAMAGSIRGVLPFTKVKVDYVFSQNEIDKLQPRTLGLDEEEARAANVITEIRPYGNIVWGNRTLCPIKEENNSVGLKASHFLNIRQLCCDIKKHLYRVSRRFTFEPNSDVLWINFKNAITPLLEEMKSGQGIKGYRLVKVETKSKATLQAIIKIIPIEAAEDFDLTVELADSISITE